MATIKIKWAYIEWDVGFTWAKDIVPQIQECKLNITDLNRAVYIIRTKGNFAIDYPKLPSPTLYIGEGDFRARISRHKTWLKELRELVGEFPFEIAIAIPRAKNNVFMYKEMEADLLHEFKSIYGVTPLLNKQLEYHNKEHTYLPYKEFIRPLQIGRGKRIAWGLRPLPSNRQYDNYWKTAE